MGVTKIVYGKTVLMNVSSVTVTPERLIYGRTALNKNGDLISGTRFAGYFFEIKNPAFQACVNLSYVDLPDITKCTYPFYGLTVLSLPNVSYIGWVGGIDKLYLMGSSIVSTSMEGYAIDQGINSIFVRSSLYSRWITAPNWSEASSRFFSYIGDD